METYPYSNLCVPFYSPHTPRLETANPDFKLPQPYHSVQPIFLTISKHAELSLERGCLH